MEIINNQPTNSGLGDTLKISFDKVNANFAELQTQIDAQVGLIYMGSINPSSAAPIGVEPAFWTATEAGTYTNYGGVIVLPNSFAVISRDSLGAFSISQTPLDLGDYATKAFLEGNSGYLTFLGGAVDFGSYTLFPNDEWTIEMNVLINNKVDTQMLLYSDLGNVSIFISGGKMILSKSGFLNTIDFDIEDLWLDVWTYISISFNNGDYDVKVNNETNSFNLISSNLYEKNPGIIKLGNNIGATIPFEGSLQLLRVYDNQLTTLESDTHYNSGSISLYESVKTDNLLLDLHYENLDSINWYDNSIYNLKGELTGGTLVKSNKPIGNINYIEPFKGVEVSGSGNINLPSLEYFDVAEGTIEFTFKPLTTTGIQIILSTTTGGPQIYLFDNKINFNIEAVGTILTIDLTSFINEEKTVAITYNSGVYNVYINGEESQYTVGASAGTDFSFGTAPIYLGASSTLTSGFFGNIYSFRVYSREISADEARTSYNFGRPNGFISIKDSSLTLELNGDNSNITSWYDTSDNQQIGLLDGDAKCLSGEPNLSDGTSSTVNYLDVIPDDIYVAVDREFNLFFNSFIPNYGNKVRASVACSTGKSSERSFIYKPTTVESSSMVISVKDLNDTEIESKTITLHGVSKTAGSGTKQLLFIGDSTTDSYLTDYLGTGRQKYEMLKEFKTLVTTDGGFTPLFLGLQGDAIVKHEAHSGYAIENFISNDISYPNPFWDGTKVNIQNYMSTNSFFSGSNNIDCYFIQLGINDLKSGLAPIAGYNKLKILVDDLLHPTYGYPSASIIISQTPYVCGDRTGWGEHFLAGFDYDTFVVNMIEYAKLIKENFENNISYPNVYISPNMLFVDREYGYPRTLQSASLRSSTQIYKYTDSVHPDTSGYLQAADSYYSRYRSIL